MTWVSHSHKKGVKQILVAYFKVSFLQRTRHKNKCSLSCLRRTTSNDKTWSANSFDRSTACGTRSCELAAIPYRSLGVVWVPLAECVFCNANQKSYRLRDLYVPEKKTRNISRFVRRRCCDACIGSKACRGNERVHGFDRCRASVNTTHEGTRANESLVTHRKSDAQEEDDEELSDEEGSKFRA